MLALADKTSPILTFDVTASAFQLLAMLSRERSLASDLGLLSSCSTPSLYLILANALTSDLHLQLLYAGSPHLQEECPPDALKAGLTPSSVKAALQALGNGAATIDASSPFYATLPSRLSSSAKSELAGYVTSFLKSRYPQTFGLLNFLSLYAKVAPSLFIKTALLSVPSYRLTFISASIDAAPCSLGSLAYKY